MKNKEKLYEAGGCICSAVSCIPMFIVTFIAIASFAGFQVQLFVPSNFTLNLALLVLLIISAILIMYAVKAIPKARNLSITGSVISVGTMILMTGGSGFATHSAHLNNPLILFGFWIGYALLVGSLYYSHRKTFLGVLLPLIAAIAFLSLILGIGGAALSIQNENTLNRTSSSSPDLVVEKNNFVREVTLNQYTKEENYFPVFSKGKAVLRITNELTEGKVKIGIMDGVAQWVLVKEVTPQDTSSLQFVTEESTRGTWMVILKFEKTAGNFKIEMKPEGV